MKKLSDWLAAVVRTVRGSSKRFVAVVAAVAMLGGVAGVSATAMAADANADTTQSQTTTAPAAGDTTDAANGDTTGTDAGANAGTATEGNAANGNTATTNPSDNADAATKQSDTGATQNAPAAGASADANSADKVQSADKLAANVPAPLSLAKVGGAPDDPTLDAPAHHKTVKDNKDGTYTVSLNVTGGKETSSGEVTKNQPLDIALVLDVSGSMAQGMTDSDYTRVNNNQVQNDGSYYCKDSYGAWVKLIAYDGYPGWWYYYDSHGNYSDAFKPGESIAPTFYRVSGTSRLAALKSAVNGFIDSTAAYNQTVSDAASQNRISIVSFSDDATTNQGLTYATTANAGSMKQTVNSLTANGGTQSGKAMNQAQSVLAGARQDANKVVIFFTDGQPGQSGWDANVANAAISTAKDIKANGASIYTIGVVDGADPSDTSSTINGFMHGVSSNYPNATAYNRLGQGGNNGYYQTATNAAELANIFKTIQETITKTATYADVTIKDKLSNWVVNATDGSNKPSGFTYSKTVDGKTSPLADAPEATVDDSGVVSWMPVADGNLEDGVTYTVSFKVKATQAAYDAAAKNHKDEATASGDNNFYTNDNDQAKVSYKTVVTTSGSGSQTSDEKNVAYEKPTITLPVSKIKVTKTWADGNDNHKGDSVKVQLKQDDKDYGEAATLNADGGWTHEFTVSAGPDGYTYSVSEVKVDGYDSTVDHKDGLKLQGLTAQSGAFTVTNTPSTVTLPASEIEVTKEVQGRGAAADFTFNLQCEDNGDAKCANIEGLTNNGLTATVKQNQLSSSGDTATANFGKSTLKFKVPTGTATQLVYKFNVSEVIPSNTQGWAYDKSTHEVTVTVAKDDADGQWKATVTGNSPKFTNRYVAVSALPLTGGTTGREWLMAGSGMGLLALLAAASYSVWRKRQLV